MTFFNLVINEIKLQLRNVTFYIFVILVFLFYFYQYNEEVNRIHPPKPEQFYGTVEITSEEERCVLGYKQLYGILKSKEVQKYTPIAKKVKLTDNQAENLKRFLTEMAPNADVINTKLNDIKINYEALINYMDDFDKKLGGNTTLGRKYRQFIRAMTYEEALIEYGKKKNNKEIADIHARALADYLGISAGIFVVFTSVSAMLRDKRFGVQDLIYSSNIKPLVYISSKFIGLLISNMSVFILIGVVESVTFLYQSVLYRVPINILVFFKYILGWVGPTVMGCTIFTMLISIVAENNIIPIVIQLSGTMGLLVNTRLTGEYDFTRFIIRFNGFNSSEYYHQFSKAIIYNRIFYVGISLLLVYLTTYIWSVRRDKALRGIQCGN